MHTTLNPKLFLFPATMILAASASSQAATAPYRDAVLALNPVAYWEMDESSGDLADSGGNSHTGTAAGANNYGYGVASAAAVLGTAIQFDASTAGFAVAAAGVADFDPNGGFTVMAWARINIGDGDGIVTKGSGSRGGHTQVDWDLYSHQTLGQSFRGSSDTPSATNIWNLQSGDTTAQGEWAFLVGTWDGTTNADGVRFYVNGVAVGTATSTRTTIDHLHDIYIGGGAASASRTYDGLLDEVAIFDKELSAAEISALYNIVDLSGPPPLPVVAHYWDFQTDAGGDMIPDDLYGGLSMSAPNGPPAWETDTFYGEAYTGSGWSLNTPTGGNLFLEAETHDGSSPTALDFGAGSFAFSFWSFDHTDDTTIPPGDGNDFGAQVFDFLDGTTTGVQLGTTSAGILNFRLDDDADNVIVSNNEPGGGSVQQPRDQWVHVTLNVDRTADELTIYFDGVEQTGGGIDISSLTGNIFCTQDLMLGVRNGGGANGSQKNGLDDFAIYPDVLTQQQITDLAGSVITPLDVISSFETTEEISIVDVSYAAGEVTVVFASENGKTYSVYGGQDLDDVGTWPEISTTEITGDGTDLSFPYTPGVTPFFLQVRED